MKQANWIGFGMLLGVGSIFSLFIILNPKEKWYKEGYNDCKNGAIPYTIETECQTDTIFKYK